MSAEDDLERALHFINGALSQLSGDVAESRSLLYALVEQLAERDTIDLAKLEERREHKRAHESQRAPMLPRVALAANVDKYRLQNLPQIDCASLLPLCKGRCCQLRFPLSEQDLDERVVRWDYGRPYMVLQNQDGRCSHQTETLGCGVYEKRPAACRLFDCREDKRIWLDFEKRIPAPD